MDQITLNLEFPVSLITSGDDDNSLTAGCEGKRFGTILEYSNAHQANVRRAQLQLKMRFHVPPTLSGASRPPKKNPNIL